MTPGQIIAAQMDVLSDCVRSSFQRSEPDYERDYDLEMKDAEVMQSV